MREKALAVDCPAREPDPVLLEQLTALAAASSVPTARPWWQRFTVKTGAAAVAGVLLISGATADAEHGRPAPIAVTIVGSTPHAAPHRTTVHVSTPQSSAPVSPVVSQQSSGPMRHAWNRSEHPRKHQRARGVKHEKGSSNGGGSQNGQIGAQLARLAEPVLSATPPVSDGRSRVHRHGHGHAQH